MSSFSSGNVDCAWGGMVLDQTDSKDSKNKKAEDDAHRAVS